MYGKVYKIEGDETSTEAATRLWVMELLLLFFLIIIILFTLFNYIYIYIYKAVEKEKRDNIIMSSVHVTLKSLSFVSFNHVAWTCSFFQLCLCVLRRPPHEAAGRCEQPSRIWGGLQSLPPHEETGLLKPDSAPPGSSTATVTVMLNCILKNIHIPKSGAHDHLQKKLTDRTHGCWRKHLVFFFF